MPRQYQRVQLSCDGDKIRTQQHFKDECDINVLTQRWLKGGGKPPPPTQLNYGDFSNVTDFMSAKLAISNAEHLFQSLPARVRSRFENSPAQLLAFAEDPNNLTEAVALGLAMPAQTPQEPTPPGEGEETPPTESEAPTPP